MPGSSIELLNNNLSHVCDFKFIFDIQGGLDIGLINPVTAIQNAYQKCKIESAIRLRSIVQQAVTVFKKL
jgi:hypothetical protein